MSKTAKPMTDQKRAAILYEAISDIAARNEYPPAPGDYFAIKTIWKSMVMRARRAKAKIDAAAQEPKS